MSCNRPYTAFKTGEKTEKGKDLLVMVPGNADNISLTSACKKLHVSLKPDLRYMYQDGGEFWLREKVSIPCGKCQGCLADRRRTWSERFQMEMKYYDRSTCWFITLTFDDKSLPADGLVSKRDVQLFLKRLRKRVDSPFKYIACGEYGHSSYRPHYHLCVCGLELSGKYLADKSFKSPELIDSWTFGRVFCVPCFDAAVSYVCGYCLKKLSSKDKYLAPVFLYSKGIGKRYFFDHKDEILKFDSVYMKGRKKVPPYFDKLMEDNADFLELLTLEDNKNFRKEKGEINRVSSLSASGLSCLEELQDFNESMLKNKTKARNLEL